MSNTISCKVNKNKVKQRGCVQRMKEFIFAYPKCRNLYLTERAYCDLIEGGVETEDNLVACAKNYAEACRINETPRRYIKDADNFLKEFTFEKYLPGKYVKPARIVAGKGKEIEK
ncbi:hypothetical protein E5329_23835 [Petralouisia muris]|uniref:Uncharacterized protein n=1 Tax=Petralouisia muris TaxID=3032872 RepID=A0AC61RQW2_9FIRM|nr:hypothetical protein [Petralouisia muris]TGY90872.1 hypothetical protein E5329_23835 [Petralouisia muris]